jgi:hypothetical protein
MHRTLFFVPLVVSLGACGFRCEPGDQDASPADGMKSNAISSAEGPLLRMGSCGWFS